MRGDRRRMLRRASLVAALACLALSLTVPARAQDEDALLLPDIFRGAANSLVASAGVDRSGLLPVDGLFNFIALDGASIYETDNQTARASLLFPGNAGIQGPNLLCDQVDGYFPPDFAPIFTECSTTQFPLTVKADSSRSSVATPGSLSLGAPTDPLSGEFAAAKAHAALDAATTTAAVNDLRVLGFPGSGTLQLLPTEQLELDSSLLRIGAATSRTDQRVDERGVLKIDATSVLTGVRLIGGLIEIGSIRSVSTVTDDAAGERTADASFEVSGVTVAGVPAQITDKGLVIGSPAGGPLQQQLADVANQLVEALGIQITLLDVVETLEDDTGQAAASAGGLLLEMVMPVDFLPPVPFVIGGAIDLNGNYVTSLRLGSTGAAGEATDFETEIIPPEPVDFGGETDIDPGGSFDPGFDTGAVDPGPVEVPTAPRAPAQDDSGPRLVRAVVDTFGGRMGLLYLAFTFAVLGLCLMPGLAFPARLPGSRS